MNHAAKGRSREKSVMAILRKNFYAPRDARGSHGVDILAFAMNGDERYLAIAVGGKGKNVLEEFLKLSAFLNEWAGDNTILRKHAVPVVAKLRGRKWTFYPNEEIYTDNLIDAIEASKNIHPRGVRQG